MKVIITIIILIASVYGGILIFDRVSEVDVKKSQPNTSVDSRPAASPALLENKPSSESNLGSLSQVGVVTAPTDTNVFPAVQIIKGAIVDQVGLVPANYSVKVGQPVRFEISSNVDVDGCMSTIMIYDLYDKPSLIKAGKTIVMEFTPTKSGTYDISCAMGVPWGELKVIN